ncbi:hypothetical protein ABZ128_10015 [Streptomyces sp. NPDC006326]|uniref:hypothetical protein n=1 Tax=Streptomyces sp. NPDC006326 TaxID=3156752 RepID=UPI0033B0C72F
MVRHPVVVYPIAEGEGRRVRVDGTILGTAYSDRDLSEFLRRAGAPEPDEMVLSALIEWREDPPQDYGAGLTARG